LAPSRYLVGRLLVFRPGAFQISMASSGAVAVFAGLTDEMRGRVFVLVSGLEADHLLRVPAGDVAGDALGIIDAIDPGLLISRTARLQRFGRLGMLAREPDVIRRFVALAADLCAHERIASGLEGPAAERVHVSEIVDRRLVLAEVVRLEHIVLVKA